MLRGEFDVANEHEDDDVEQKATLQAIGAELEVQVLRRERPHLGKGSRRRLSIDADLSCET